MGKTYRRGDGHFISDTNNQPKNKFRPKKKKRVDFLQKSYDNEECNEEYELCFDKYQND